MDQGVTAPSVFISYSHADQSLARDIAKGLDEAGLRVWVDEGELRVGDSLVLAISRALGRVDFVVALVSPDSVDSDWCRKEISLAMTDEIAGEAVLVMPVRIDGAEMPDTLRDKLYLDATGIGTDAVVARLAESIDRHLHPKPELPPRRPRIRPGSVPSNASVSPGPISVRGIDVERITRPRNDGSPGSALYSVPFILSSSPDQRWVDLFMPNWDRPPSWTSMHRPGIARVSGDRIVLEGTTIEEVEKYHLETLKLAIAETNRQYDLVLQRIERQARAIAEQDAQRQAAIDDALGRLDFDN